VLTYLDEYVVTMDYLAITALRTRHTEELPQAAKSFG
jgi:hypothetical protein